MPNLLFLSDNQSFAEDLSGQIKLYAPDFNIFYEDNGQNFYALVAGLNPTSHDTS